MPQVSYLALDEAGREVRGDVEAVHRGAAASLLRARGLRPLELNERSPSQPRELAARVRLPSFVSTGDRVQFLRQIALMLRSGLTLLESLEALSQTNSSSALRKVARRLSARVQAGTPLSGALERERTFPSLVAHLVRTAEATGELEGACQRAAEFLESRAALRYQLMSSLFYPGIVLAGAVGVFWFMTTQVVPKFAAFLAGRGRALPWTTQTLMDLSAWLVAHGASLLYGSGALVAALILVWRTERGRTLVDRVTIRTPGLALILRTASMAHLGQTLAMLLGSGLPLLEALRVAASTFGHRGYRAILSRAAERVVHGASLAQSLEHPTVTPLFLHLVAIGERTGALDGVLSEVGEHYQGRLQRLLRVMSGLVEPVVIVIVGGMVGFVYVSFFQALFSLAR